MKLRYAFLSASIAAMLALGPIARAQVTLVEGGHTVTKLVDSIVPLHPSQTLLETTLPVGAIESIACDKLTTELYVQLIIPPNVFHSASSHIFKVIPSTGVVSVVSANTHLGINDRGTDLGFDQSLQMLITEDMNVTPTRLVKIDINTGVVSTYSIATPHNFLNAEFGMDFSLGMGGTDVPLNQVVFTSDLGNGVNSAANGGLGTTNHVPGGSLPGGGGDLVIQPNGNWVWVGDFNNGIISINPAPPHTQSPSGLSVQQMFTDAGLTYTAGSRATVCKSGGEVYVSCGYFPGGTGIFRVDAALTSSTLVATIPTAFQGLQDLTMGPSSAGAGESLYFTVQDSINGSEQVWELTTPECEEAECFLILGPDHGLQPWGVANHIWDTHISQVQEAYVVTQDRGPEFIVPDFPDLRQRTPFVWPVAPANWKPDRFHISAQVLMWNPVVFPNNPEQWTNGLDVIIWPHHKPTITRFGSSNNMTLGVDFFAGIDGKMHMKFPFVIK